MKTLRELPAVVLLLMVDIVVFFMLIILVFLALHFGWDGLIKVLNDDVAPIYLLTTCGIAGAFINESTHLPGKQDENQSIDN